MIAHWKCVSRIRVDIHLLLDHLPGPCYQPTQCLSLPSWDTCYYCPKVPLLSLTYPIIAQILLISLTPKLGDLSGGESFVRVSVTITTVVSVIKGCLFVNVRTGSRGWIIGQTTRHSVHISLCPSHIYLHH